MFSFKVKVDFTNSPSGRQSTLAILRLEDYQKYCAGTQYMSDNDNSIYYTWNGGHGYGNFTTSTSFNKSTGIIETTVNMSDKTIIWKDFETGTVLCRCVNDKIHQGKWIFVVKIYTKGIKFQMIS